jgi:hypothetical protein
VSRLLASKLPTPHCLLAAALAHLGRTDEARQAAGQGVELNPNFTITRFRAWSFSDHPIYLAGRERIYEGMRLAGVPEE